VTKHPNRKIKGKEERSRGLLKKGKESDATFSADEALGDDTSPKPRNLV
jgi:hypothetical protein